MDIDKLVKITEDKLSPYVTKAPLSDKYLSRPPFKYLHRIVMEVIEKTGFAPSYFSKVECDEGTYETQKEMKIVFLTKLNTLIGICIGRPVDCDPKMVTAGKEAEKTNIMLQQFIDAVSNTQLDVEEATKRATNNEMPGSRPPPLKRSTDSKIETKSVEPSKSDINKVEHTETRLEMPKYELTATKTMELLSLGLQNKSLVSKFQDKYFSRPPFSFIHRILQSTIEQGFGRSIFTTAELGEVDNKEIKIVILQKLTDIIQTIDSSFNWDITKVLSGKEEQETNFRFFQIWAFILINNIDTNKYNKHSTNAIPNAETRQEVQKPHAEQKQTVTYSDTKSSEQQSSHKLNSNDDRGASQSVLPDISNLNLSAARTQQLVEEAVSDPGLSSKFQEKHFGRPPFSFIQKIVIRMIERSGFLQGKFSKQELDSTDDKDMKRQFLNNLIDGIQSYYRCTIQWDSIKVLSGKEEPENNYKFLQMLSLASIHYLNSKSNASSNISNVPQMNNQARTEDTQQKTVKPEANRQESLDKAQSASKPAESNKLMQQNESEQKSNDSKSKIRPTTAHRKPPKVKDNVHSDDGIPMDIKLPQGLLIGDNDDSDEEEKKAVDVAILNSNDPHSKLVQNIINETKMNETKTDEKDSNKGIFLHRGGKTAKSANQFNIDNLQEMVQLICKNAAPLSKTMDFVIDDIESMKIELVQWEEESKKQSDLYEVEKNRTDVELQSLYQKMSELDDEINQQQSKIIITKGNISTNETRIFELLRLAAHPN